MPLKTLDSRRWAVLIAGALITAGIVFLAEVLGWLQPLENKAFDGLFYLRAKTGPSEQRPPSPVALIAIDDATFADENFRIPQILWHKYFAQVIKALADGQARAVGLDFLLPQAMFDDLVPEYSRTWLKIFVYAQRAGAPVITGYIHMGGRRITPLSRYMQVIGPERLGLFNLTTDSDDFIRRQRLYFPADNGNGVSSVAWLLAKAYEPGLTLPAETIYIDYNPSPGAVSAFSFARVYEKAVQGETEFFIKNFQGRVVLIGETDALTQDRHPTPMYYLASAGHKRTPGVEIMAQTVAALVEHRFFKETPAWLNPILYFGLALAAGGLTLYAPARLWPLWAPTVFLILAAGGLAAFKAYTILPLAGGSAALVIGQTWSFFYRYLVVDRDKRRTKNLFARYLPAKVIDKALAGREADFMKGENRRLCVMFTDIRSFTTYSEKKEPAEVVARLNEYFEAMSEVVVSQGGVVDKFLGDGIMAFFGAFDHGPPPSEAGARAALRMLDVLDKLNKKWEAAGQEIFRIGIGLHTGQVKVGNIGSEKKMEYTVIGDAVNLASRLQDKTKVLGEDIVISQSVYDDLGESAIARDLGVVDIKGREQSRVFGLKGLEEKS